MEMAELSLLPAMRAPPMWSPPMAPRCTRSRTAQVARALHVARVLAMSLDSARDNPYPSANHKGTDRWLN